MTYAIVSSITSVWMLGYIAHHAVYNIKSTEYSPHYSGNKNKVTKIILARFCYVRYVLATVQIAWHFCICCVQEWNIHVCVYCFSFHNMVCELCDVSITNLAICDMCLKVHLSIQARFIFELGTKSQILQLVS